MSKKYTLILMIFIVTIFYSSCNYQRINSKIDELFISNGQRADIRMDQIVSAIKDKDKEALKSLFSKKAIDESGDIDNGIDSFLSFIKGDMVSWDRDVLATSSLLGGGKKSLMLRFCINIKSEIEDYIIFIIDYNVDTKNPDNEGVYMMQISTSGYNEDLGSWQDRLQAGLFIPEFGYTFSDIN